METINNLLTNYSTTGILVWLLACAFAVLVCGVTWKLVDAMKSALVGFLQIVLSLAAGVAVFYWVLSAYPFILGINQY